MSAAMQVEGFADHGIALALVGSDWILSVSSSTLGLQYAPRLNWPDPLSSTQRISALRAFVRRRWGSSPACRSWCRGAGSLGK